MKEKSKLTEKLSLLADPSVFPDKGTPLVRWGQILRTTPVAAKFMEDAKKVGFLIPLQNLARVRSGVVTRANAFFIVRDFLSLKSLIDFGSLAEIIAPSQ